MSLITFEVMNTSDLRIGNYIEVLQDNVATSSTGVKSVYYRIVKSTDQETLENLKSENYQPILLNKEWLAKCNAKGKFDDDRIAVGNLCFRLTQIGLIECDENFEPLKGKKLIRYVHQLQNLFFQTNQEELQIDI